MHGGDIYRNKVALDFSVNINPLGMPEGVREALHEAVDGSIRYPDYKNEELQNKLSEYLQVPSRWLCMGNGASELFLAAVHALQPEKVLLQAPSFSGYSAAVRGAEHCAIEYVVGKEEEDFRLTEEILPRLTEDVDLLFLANPNNPVGAEISGELLNRILERAESAGIYVVLDECFLEFSKEAMRLSPVRALERYPHVIVVRAFTKICAIPGVRLGYSICSDEGLCERIRCHLPEWNLSVYAQRAGVAAVEALLNTSYLADTWAVVEAQRKWLEDELGAMGIRCFPSRSNFLLLYSGFDLYEPLLERGILIRDCSDYVGLKKGYYRVAVQSREKNERLVEEIMEIEFVLPSEIEKRSFEIIGQELKERGIVLPGEEEAVTKRVIHTSADFDYASTMTYSPGAVSIALDLLRNGADIVTDTNMALAGINKKRLEKYGGEAHCYMADEEIAGIAQKRQTTRASVSMERAAELKKPVIFAIGNAPTALIALHELMKRGYQPAFIIGVPVGFVNVEAAKELILASDVPHIVNRGRKGGSNVAAAICNALLYQL